MPYGTLMDREQTPADPAGAAILAFLRRVRRRRTVAGALGGCLFAALLNEAVRWSCIGVNLWAGRRILPVFDVGLLFLPALGLLLWRRRALARTALAVDARLGFNDRLASFLDFAARTDVSSQIRRAQAQEAARALAPVRIGSVAPLRPWLAAGPALLLASLIYPLLVPTMEQTPAVRLLQRFAVNVPGGFVARPGEREAGAPADRAAATAPRPGKSPHGETVGKAREDAPPEPPANRPEQATTKTANGSPLIENGKQERQRPGAQESRPEEPAGIASERVGTKLAEVVDPILAPGAAGQQPPPPPTGSFAFHLLPSSSRPGALGALTGESHDAVRVAVDFDALPEEYRPLVRTYFELLAHGAGEAPAPTGGREVRPRR
jgi:hypothetical protein